MRYSEYLFYICNDILKLIKSNDMEKTATIEIDGQHFQVTGEYDAGEEMVRYYPDGSGYPGSPSCFEATEIIWLKQNEETSQIPIDVTDLINTIHNNSKDCDIVETIEELAIAEIEDY